MAIIKFKKTGGYRKRTQNKKKIYATKKTSSTKRPTYGNYMPKRTNMFNNQFKKFA